jgi:hypothetical protein
MSSQAQIDANRLNAQKSTGPRTPEGRAAVRLNGVTHGLTAATLVLKGESEDDFKALFESLEAEHQPTTPTEEILVADLAMATWRRRRLYNMEAGFYKVNMKEQAYYAEPKILDHNSLLGEVANNYNNTMALIGRQEARLERSYYRALHELQRLRALRPVLIEPPEQEALGSVCNQPKIQVDSPSVSQVNEIPQPPKQAPQSPAAPSRTS